MVKKLIVAVLVLIILVGGVGYWREWFVLTKDGNAGVQVDSGKFKDDREAFGKAFGEKAKALKVKVAGLWKTHEGQTPAERAKIQKELDELTKKHERLEEQIKELNEAGPEKFESTKRDLGESLDDVEKKIEELTKKIDKGSDK